MPPKIDIEAIYDLIRNNYLKNRTTVSQDIPSLIDDIEKTAGIKVIRHCYKTGDEHGTWITPPSWDVKEAWLKDAGTGEIIASYNEHPLFVCPYSCAVDAKISRSELLPHLFLNTEQPDVFSYNHRLAYDPGKMLSDWQLSIPYERVKKLGDGPFHVFIDTRVSDGEMIVAEILLKGRSKTRISFLAHFCHPGQVNDNFSSIGVLAELAKTLSRVKDRKYTYSFLFFPETIGSSIYLASNPDLTGKTIGALCMETVGWGEKWYLKETREPDTYMNKLARACLKRFHQLNTTGFMTINRNDELVFDSVQAGIPTLSLQKFPYQEYHTNKDDMTRLSEEALTTAYQICDYMIHIAEQDDIYTFVHNVPFHMSRYGLYADAVFDEKKCSAYRNIMNAIDGRASLLDIALKFDLSFDEVYEYVRKMLEHGLVSKKQVNKYG